VPYAVVEGNAVAAWVSRVDESAVRNTQDVDLLIRRADLIEASGALERAGFERRHVAGVEMFLDGAQAKARDASWLERLPVELAVRLSRLIETPQG
jgi:hypothetical protein